ncbi:C4-dicarboxylate ABC transporter [Vibrio cholerae]|nr:C4-dicarboxylate ABC transporter [Vibrio cholerae]TXX45544.1 C4-dicarboxylate ABC transporter [Vibrio cholerae]TYA07394.1 C4-dicarboxylate ABC transporter [Vibrio cholerae]
MRKIHVMVCSRRKWKYHARERLNYQQVKSWMAGRREQGSARLPW